MGMQPQGVVARMETPHDKLFGSGPMSLNSLNM